MDCPNCGAYNASSSFRCRRCGNVLPAENGEETSRDDWGPASGPGDHWDDSQEEPQAEDSSAWTSPEPEPAGEPDWDSIFPESSTSSDPYPEERERPTYGASSYGYSPDVPNYLWPSIGATLCCCAPLGIPAIIYASRVDAYLKTNDRAAAEEASSKAKNWALAAAGASLLGWVAFFMLGAIG